MLVAVLLLALLGCVARSAKVYRYNAGGLRVGDYEPDPINFVKGKNLFHRGPRMSGLGVGTSHRWAGDTGFAYEFPTGEGTFDIDLVFAEIFEPAQTVGGRVFSVAAEGEILLDNYDVYKKVGANKELKETLSNIKTTDGTLSLSFIKGPQENPMVSGISIRQSNGEDFEMGEAVTGEGTDGKAPDNIPDGSDFDHQAHAVAGGPYTETDFNNDGEIILKLDGTLSHSHYNNPDTGESGVIKKYSWAVNGKTISEKPIFTAKFQLGVTKLVLTVTDQKGDTATANTEVLALPSSVGGVYCYYYGDTNSIDPKLKSNPRPEEGHSNNVIDFDDDEFKFSRKDAPANIGGTDEWAARCLTDVTVLTTKRYKLSVKYRGAGAAIYVKGVLKASGGASDKGPKTITANTVLTIGATSVQVIYYQKGSPSSLQFLIDDEIAPPSALGFQSSDIIPTISRTSSPTANPDGNGQLQISGTGFFNNPTVKIGNHIASFSVVSATEIVVNPIPSEAEAGSTVAPITVTNNAGVSNVMELTYEDNGGKGVSWDQTFLKSASGDRLSVKQITSIAIGPDSKYYLGSIQGFVTNLDVDKDLKVTSQCVGDKLGDSRAILGLAFNYKSSAVRVYVTSNTLYWAFGGPFKGKVDGWANGAVETFISGCGCLCYEKKIVTGLPVSNHDHGVNGLVFLPNGDLLINVGGATNAGVNTPGNKLGGWPESPLSAAVVIAKLSKGSSFNGNIKYEQYTDPETTKQTAGDVSVYAPGLRNPFGITLLTNGEVWATDNGGNFDFGEVSKDCTTDIPFSEKMYDEINKIIPGLYYGHPNRNRGGSQCVFQGGSGKAATLVTSATTGIAEYTSNVFGKDLKGELILSKYPASGSGQVWRMKAADQAEEIAMADYSGLSVVVGKHGELIMPRVQQGFVAVLKPKYSVPSEPMVIAVSPRRGLGGSKVFVSGENFAEGMSVSFGGKAGTDIDVVNSNGLYVKVPSGSGNVVVQVTVGGATSANPEGYDFIYA
ncbi:unnamed protein product [Chondrus crispus]|uniref:IPT/TIG domain-containing protein n=1 Tax=Chondrus crispus TaxID=2769 RepID=R7Q429_CHOCR|nr:unnamed protein product [Chondrus crispus]CDF32774.1 unnamed protein product [Chondrus crispus]|eukprot:XP_005712575.1 unnamed protein product [Chondrus crispus]